jgi:amino acid adenylation domain-containing protein
MTEQSTNQNTVDVHPNLENVYELSSMQQGMLFHTLYSPGSGVYFEQSIFTIEGDFDFAAFQSAWRHVIARHSILRTGFIWEEVEKPLQIVYRNVHVDIEKHDWREFDAAQQQELLEKFIHDDQVRGFDLTRPPLLRLALFRADQNTYKLVWSRHHLILDRWSRAIVLKEVSSFYESFRKGLEPETEEARPYGDYIGWLLKQDQAAAESFWRESLRGFENPTEISLGHGSSASQTYDSQSERLSSEATSKLRKFSREQKLTMNTLVQGAWSLLLSRYSGENDVLFGGTVAGRPAELAGVERMVGLFINTLPVRVKIPSHTRLLSWLHNLQAQQADQRQYEYSSLIDIQSWSDVPRGVPLFDSILVFENLPVETSSQQTSSDLIIRADRGVGSRTSYPLTMIVNPGSELSIQAIYDRGRFDAESIRRLLRHFNLLLEQFAAASQRSLAEISLLDAAEANQILHEWNNTSSEFVSEPVHKKVERQARETPNAVAVANDNQTLTYDELNRRANQLARLLQRKAVCAEQCVALCLEPSIEMVIGLLAILKAGAAYLPIDAEFPANRINFILADASVKLILTTDAVMPALAACDIESISIDGQCDEISQMDPAQPEVAVHPENLAYVIYTSGSTGNPKGVSMAHVTLANLLDWQQREYPLRTKTRVLQFSAFTFDVCFQEMFSTWVGGGTLVLTTKDVRRDPSALWKLIQQESVERIFLPFVALQQLAQAAEANPGLGTSLKEIFTAGEQLEMTPSVESLMRRLPAARLHNHYGPTESHVVSAFTVPSSESDRTRFPPIGRPIANTQIYLLDQELAPVPAGVRGELYIGGISLSRGYQQRPDLTADRFVPNPFTDEPGRRLYRTGDVARFLPDGNIEFLGRRDNQVKIRGYRIETAEIESTLRQHPAVREAVVTVREDSSEKRLVAYLVLQPKQTITTDQFRTHLQQSLPDYMVLSTFVVLDQLPLTASGKIDRRQLPAPDDGRPELAENYVGPRTPLEQEVAGIWEQVLKLKKVGVHDNFFALGGHSLLATQVISRVNASLQIEMPLRTMFEHPTVARFAIAAAQRQATIAENETIELLGELSQLSEEEAQRLLDSEIVNITTNIPSVDIE